MHPCFAISLAASLQEQSLRAELEKLKLENVVLQKKTNEIPSLLLRLSAAEAVHALSSNATPATTPASNALSASASLLQLLKKSSATSDVLLADCCSQLRKLEDDGANAHREMMVLRDTLCTSNASSAQLVEINAALRERLSASLESQGAMALRSGLQGESLASAEARLAAFTSQVCLKDEQGAFKSFLGDEIRVMLDRTPTPRMQLLNSQRSCVLQNLLQRRTPAAF